MHYIYIIFSECLNKYYVGYTSYIPERLKKHNSIHKGFTGSANDWNVKYSESFQDKTSALKIK